MNSILYYPFMKSVQANTTKDLTQQHDMSWLTTEIRKFNHRLHHHVFGIISSSINRFSNFFTGTFRSKLTTESSSKNPPHLKRVATLPGEILMSVFECQHSQGSVATRTMCAAIYNCNFTKNSLLSAEL